MMKLTIAAGFAASFLFSAAFAQQLAPLNSDTKKDRMDWSELEAKLGPFPKLPDGKSGSARQHDAVNASVH